MVMSIFPPLSNPSAKQIHYCYPAGNWVTACAVLGMSEQLSRLEKCVFVDWDAISNNGKSGSVAKRSPMLARHSK